MSQGPDLHIRIWATAATLTSAKTGLMCCCQNMNRSNSSTMRGSSLKASMLVMLRSSSGAMNMGSLTIDSAGEIPSASVDDGLIT